MPIPWVDRMRTPHIWGLPPTSIHIPQIFPKDRDRWSKEKDRGRGKKERGGNRHLHGNLLAEKRGFTRDGKKLIASLGEYGDDVFTHRCHCEPFFGEAIPRLKGKIHYL
jgi:hypothetical protein